MNSLEDRLRDAYHAAADTVKAETLRGAPDRGAGRDSARGALPAESRRAGDSSRRSRLDRPGWSRGRMLGVPLAAAAAAAAIAVTSSIAVPRVFSGQPAREQAPVGGLAQGYPGNRLPGAAPPRFFVSIQPSTSNVDYATTLSVFNSATGRLVGRLASPVPNRYFQTVAALGNDRTFVVAASPGQASGKWRTCGTWLYRFRLTPQGRPVGLTLLMPKLAGFAYPNALAASADGSTVAYDVLNCVETRAGVVRDYGHVGVLNVPSDRVKNWIYKSPAIPVSLSLSADGSLLDMVSNPSNGTRAGSDSWNRAWLLHTRAAPGQLGQRYRKVAGPPEGVAAAVLSPTGSVTDAITISSARNSSRLTFGAYQTATGRLIRQLRVFPRLGSTFEPGLSPDISGRYVLVYSWTDRLELLDLRTGHNSFVPGTAQPDAWSVAW